MSTYPNILQWNCRGIGANFNDLKLLLSKGVQVACLQETRLPILNVQRNISLHIILIQTLYLIPFLLQEG